MGLNSISDLQFFVFQFPIFHFSFFQIVFIESLKTCSFSKLQNTHKKSKSLAPARRPLDPCPRRLLPLVRSRSRVCGPLAFERDCCGPNGRSLGLFLLVAPMPPFPISTKAPRPGDLLRHPGRAQACTPSRDSTGSYRGPVGALMGAYMKGVLYGPLYIALQGPSSAPIVVP